MNTNPAPSSFSVIWRRIAKASVFFIASVMAYGAYTDYVGTLTNRIILDPDSLPVVADGYQVGDIISYIAESTPDYSGSEVGAGAWNTIFVPPGVEVVNAEIVQSNGDGTYSAIPPTDISDIADGCGNRGCQYPTTGLVQNGKLNEGQQDTGIFYSTDARTALLGVPYSISPTGPKVKPQQVWNEWDYQQVVAFGTGDLNPHGVGSGNTAVVDTSGGSGMTWAGTGSPVAGPLTYFKNDYAPNTCATGTNDNLFDAGDVLCQGPWQRINYAGSKFGGVGPVMPTTVDPGPLLNTSVLTAAGYGLSPATPLPAGTNAVRYVIGKRRIGELENVRISFRITDAVAFTNSLMNSSFCFDATGGDADKPSRGPQDNIWRYYEGNNHYCFEGSTDATFTKTAITVDGAPAPGTAGENTVVGYELHVFNTGTMPLYDINVSDTPGSTGLTLLAEGADPLCPYPTYDGNYTGMTPAFNSIIGNSATWQELPVLGAGQEFTVFICAQIEDGANFGDAYINNADVTYAITDGGTPEPLLTSGAQLVISNVISGTVFFDNDRSGSDTTGDTYIAGVTVLLYDDSGSVPGLFDNNDQIVDTQLSSTTGYFAFVGHDPGTYFVVEYDSAAMVIGLTDFEDTADADNPYAMGMPNCGTGNGCNIIAVSLAANSQNHFKNFYNVGASIGDFLWNDLNGDGIQDGGTETGIDGVTLDLYQDVNGDGAIDGGDILLKTTTTAGGGAYDFNELPPGDYLVDVTDTGSVLGGSVNTTSNDPFAITVTKAQDYNDADFGYQVVADLFVTKDDSSATYTPGGSGTYIIVVGNYGPSNVTGATVADTLPLGVTLSGPVTCVATGSASCTATIGVATDISFTDSAVNITADPTGIANFVTYSVPVNYSLVPADYTP